MVANAGGFLVGAAGSISYSWPFLAGGRLSSPAGATRYRGDNIPCEQVIVRADPDNTGVIWIGGEDVLPSMCICLQAGDWSPYIAIQNLNQLHWIADNAGDWMGYILFGRPR